jgi:hypothetical protein
VRWKVPLPGPGNSTPIVWGEHVFLTQALEGGKRRALIARPRRADLPHRPRQTHWQDGVEEGRDGHQQPHPATVGEAIWKERLGGNLWPSERDNVGTSGLACTRADRRGEPNEGQAGRLSRRFASRIVMTAVRWARIH